MIIRLLIFTPNVMKSLGLYTEGLGLKCIHLSDTYAEVVDKNGTALILTKAPSLAYTYTGFTPLLMFQCTNFEETIEKLNKYGCIGEGLGLSNDAGKVSYLKSPEGLSFAIKEIQAEEETQKNEEDDHPAAEEIKKFIKKLKL
jgi:hypothetical protein